MLSSLRKVFLGSAGGTANSFGFRNKLKRFKEEDNALCRQNYSNGGMILHSQRKIAEQPNCVAREHRMALNFCSF